jgi:molecular chaperone GrpE
MPSSRASEGSEARSDAPREDEQAPERAPAQPAAPEPGLAEELARTEDRYKRAVADLDNYRKRSAREVERRAVELREALIRDWLEVVDSVERALRMDSSGPHVEGLRAVLEQIEAVLARQGVQRIGQVGERFDPERHEAIDVRVTDEVEDRTVIEVARSGFALGDRVLRPAQVVVSRRPEPAP